MTQATHSDPEQLFGAGVEAMSRGEFAAARVAFEAVAAVSRPTSQLRLLLALCSLRLGDWSAADAAVDRLLEADPRNIQGLIIKADCLKHTGKLRAAVAFYRRAIEHAGSARVPPELRSELDRARHAIETAHHSFQQRLEALAAQAADGGRGSDRFAQSIDLLLGRRKRYYQEPTGYFLPQLPDSQFYDPADFAWAAAVEALTPVIRAEYLAAMDGGGTLKPFVATSPDHPPQATGLADSLDWSAYHLFETGRRIDAHIARCPQTWAALSSLPLPMLTGTAPSIFFSVLRGGAHIKSHHGVMNTRLVCHLPLIVPPDCGLRVGNETREWEEGRLTIFNDAIEHEAWNRSDRARVVLIFEIWRPELSARECDVVTAMYQAIGDFDHGR